MTIIEYRASPPLPCDIPKMKRAKLEDLAICQMATILDLEGKVAEARSIAEQACRQHNAMLEQKRRVTCIYCGHVYPDGTPESQAALLTAHVEQCHLHPLATARAEIGRLRSVVRDCARTLQHNLSMWAIKDEPMMMRSLESAWAAVGRGFCEAPSEPRQASNPNCSADERSEVGSNELLASPSEDK